MIVLCRPCPMCADASELEVDEQGALRWRQGELIQKALPELTPDQRELLMTGFHSDCWDKAFSEEDE